MAIDNVKNIRVQTVISREIKDELEKLAKKDGRSISNYIARLIEMDVEKNKKDTNE